MKYLIITSSGGAGHLTLAKAQHAFLLSSGIAVEDIWVVDIMGVDNTIASKPGESWIPCVEIPYLDVQLFSGPGNVAHWDSCQRKGGLNAVRKLEWLIDKQFYAEKIQAHKIHLNLQHFLQAHPKIIQVIDTQAMSTSVICQAVTEENVRRTTLDSSQSPIVVRKLISEFVTDKAVHFLYPLSEVSKKNAQCLVVEIVNPPLIHEDDLPDHFYKKMKVEHIPFKVISVPVRDELKKEVYNKEPFIYLKAASDESIKGALKERPYLQNILQDMGQFEGQYFKLDKQPNDFYCLILLGSQCSNTVLYYIDSFITQLLAQITLNAKGRYFLFVAVGINDGSDRTIYAKVHEHIERRMLELTLEGAHWPAQAKIVALAFQDDKALASLLLNVNQLIIRTGGMSSMEALATQHLNPKRKVYLHSEALLEVPDVFPKANFDFCYRYLLDGTIRWEGGNAQYLMAHIDACLTSFETIQFYFNNDMKGPCFQGSLLELAVKGKLEAKYGEQIKACLDKGSDPNLVSFASISLLAHVKDFATALLLILYGGELTFAVKKHWATLFTTIEIEQLKQNEREIKQQIKKHHAPNCIYAALKTALQNSDIEALKGILYRYPKLTYVNLLHDCNYITLKEYTQKKGLEEYNLVSIIQGISLLQHALICQEHYTTEQLKKIIYLHRNELNHYYGFGVTPLTLCQNPEVRKLMVYLGANPYYLNKKVSQDEHLKLKQLYTESHLITKKLKQLILNQFRIYGANERLFLEGIQKDLTALFLFPGASSIIPDKLIHFMYKDLVAAQNEIEQMHFIDYLIHQIKKYFFGNDLLSLKLVSYVRTMMFTHAIGRKVIEDTFLEEQYECTQNSLSSV